MFKLSPQAAFLGEKEIKLIHYSDSLESDVEFALTDLEGYRVSDYPKNLQSRILSEFNVPCADEYVIYREKKAFYFYITFCNLEGQWRKNLASKPVFQAMTDLITIKKDSIEVEVNLLDEIPCLTFPIKNSEECLFSLIKSFLKYTNELIECAESSLLGFEWKDEYSTQEEVFTKELIMPLLTKMGFNYVKYNHGPSEFGKDIIFSENDRFGKPRYYAAQVKVGDISGASARTMDTILAQIDDSFSIPVEGPGQEQQFYISELYVICSGNITNNAAKKINQKIDNRLVGSIRFLDCDDIKWLAKKYWPFWRNKQYA